MCAALGMGAREHKPGHGRLHGVEAGSSVALLPCAAVQGTVESGLGLTPTALPLLVWELEDVSSSLCLSLLICKVGTLDIVSDRAVKV